MVKNEKFDGRMAVRSQTIERKQGSYHEKQSVGMNYLIQIHFFPVNLQQKKVGYESENFVKMHL